MTRTRRALGLPLAAPWVCGGLLALLLPGAARGEGTDELTATQKLRAITVIRVDILDHTTETFTWEASSLLGLLQFQAVIEDPNGVVITTLNSGDVFDPTMNGAYHVKPVGLDSDGDLIDELIEDWDITVNGAPAGVGRVWSKNWRLEAASYRQSNEWNGSLYAVVEGGGLGHDAVVELNANGLAGFQYSLSASKAGIIDGNGRSRTYESGTWFLGAGFPLYLNPPENATYDPLLPNISNTQLTSDGFCDGVAYGVSGATLSFESDVEGTYHLICDLNQDGVFDLTSDDDFHVIGDAVVGLNEWSWDGSDNLGVAVPPSPTDPDEPYECIVKLTVGEFHYVASDIETSYEGFRLFDVGLDGTRTGLDMYWNDAEVQANATLMQNGEFGLENPGPFGLWSGNYVAAATANDNARSWGAFVELSKGNAAYLDTYTWIWDDESPIFSIKVYDSTIDTDGDTLVDAAEDCVHGTDPNNPDTDGDTLRDDVEVLDLPTDALNPDTDGDGLDDGVEAPGGATVDTDGDGLDDAIDDDDDGDGIITLFETGDTDGDGILDHLDADDDGDGVPTILESGDTDGDGVENYLDDDDDGDSLPTIDEDPNGNGDWFDDDTDGDLIVNHLDPDDDGDGFPTIDEDHDGSDTVLDDDTDGDGTPDYLDPNDDGDLLDSIDEGDDDPDLDGVPNYLDDDDDGDGIPSALEDLDGDGDPNNDDTDGDLIPDWLDADDDGDGILSVDELPEDTDGDGVPNYLDPDDDGDGIDTLIEGIGDPDGDGDPNYLDDDSDGDGLLDVVEGADDVDSDGTGNFLDLDSDGDTLDDASEGTVDSDEDGAGDFVDADDDNDGVLTIDELQGGDAASAPDSDADGAKDWLDPDDDGDTIPTIEEGTFADDLDGDGSPNHLDEDADGDTILDVVEGTDDVDADGAGNWLDTDSDADGFPDAEEGEVDSDGDGLADFVDTDDDGDTLPSVDELHEDTDGDGVDNRLDTDDDGDGILTAEEVEDALTYGDDPDADGLPSWVDTDSDSDGLLDIDEGRVDADADGVPDYLDPDGLYTTWYQGSGLGCSAVGASPAGGLAGMLLAFVTLFGRRRPEVRK